MYISIFKILISDKIKCETVIVFRLIFFAIFSLTPMAPLLFTYKSHAFTHVHSYVRNTHASQQPPWPCHLSASQRNLRCCTSGEVVLYFSDLSVGQHPAQRHHHHRRQAGSLPLWHEESMAYILSSSLLLLRYIYAIKACLKHGDGCTQVILVFIY